MKDTIKKTRFIQIVRTVALLIYLAISELAQYFAGMPFTDIKYIAYRIAIDVLIVAIGAFELFVIKESRTNMFAITIFELILTMIIIIATTILHAIQIQFVFSNFKLKSVLAFAVVLFAGLSIVNTILGKIIINIRFDTLIVHSSACTERFLNKLIRDAKPYGKVSSFEINELDEESYNTFLSLLEQYDKIVLLEDLDDDIIYRLSFETVQNRRIAQTMPDIQSLSHMGGVITNIGDTPFMTVKIKNGIMLDTYLKRLFDLVSSTILIVFLLPLFLIVAIAIKLDDHGPVFYKQERYTIFKRKFNVYKFRSMRTDAEKFGAMYAQKDDPRITKVGKFIRATRIDEIPQLFNIFKGEMSFVGPRPERPIFADEYSNIVEDYDMRFLVKAGLTGYAQICGKYNTDIEDKQLYDIIYVTKFSLAMDLEILLRTVVVIFTKDATEGYEEGTEITQTAKDNAKKQEALTHE